jgi:hypothetical protein
VPLWQVAGSPPGNRGAGSGGPFGQSRGRLAKWSRTATRAEEKRTCGADHLAKPWALPLAKWSAGPAPARGHHPSTVDRGATSGTEVGDW